MYIYDTNYILSNRDNLIMLNVSFHLLHLIFKTKLWFHSTETENGWFTFGF